MPNKRTKLLIVDQNQILVEAIARLFQNHPHFNVIETTPSGISGLQLIISLEPDIIVTCGAFIDMDYILFIEELSLQKPNTRVLLLADTLTPHMIKESMRFGVLGIISVRNSFHTFEKAIKRISQGKKFFCEMVSPTIIDTIQQHETTSHLHGIYEHLSNRERQVMLALLKGSSIPEIAEMFNISPKTVSAHKSNLFSKLGILSLFQLYEMGRELGF